ncbi:MAG: ribonuclease HII, partial [Oscillospiraceae bacterium]
MIYEALYDYDDELRTQFGDLVCGTDEAGRGPLAGPVSCAAVILRAGDRFEWLNDSKKVTEKRREKLCDEIKSRCLFFSFVFIDNRVIDEINILWASMLGMSRAVEKLKAAPSLVLADGNRAPDCGKIETRCVVHGDAVSASIAAA